MDLSQISWDVVAKVAVVVVAVVGFGCVVATQAGRDALAGLALRVLSALVGKLEDRETRKQQGGS